MVVQGRSHPQNPRWMGGCGLWIMDVDVNLWICGFSDHPSTAINRSSASRLFVGQIMVDAGCNHLLYTSPQWQAGSPDRNSGDVRGRSVHKIHSGWWMWTCGWWRVEMVGE